MRLVECFGTAALLVALLPLGSAARPTADVADADVIELVVLGLVDHVGYAGKSEVLAVVANYGNATADSVEARAEYHYEGEWYPVGETTFRIGPQDRDALAFVWVSRSHIGRFEVRVTLDPDDEIPEGVEEDNQGHGRSSFWTQHIEGVWLRDLP